MEEKKDNSLAWWAAVASIGIFGLWVGTYFYLKDWGVTERGTFGDMFGSINALFSGLALAGIIITILLQREELKLQRLELAETREELKRSADAQEKSEKAYVYSAIINGHNSFVIQLNGEIEGMKVLNKGVSFSHEMLNRTNLMITQRNEHLKIIQQHLDLLDKLKS